MDVVCCLNYLQVVDDFLDSIERDRLIQLKTVYMKPHTTQHMH